MNVIFLNYLYPPKLLILKKITIFMKPLNEKERTLAFVQFLVLFILTIILTVFFVFFGTKVVKKDYANLKEENRILKETSLSSGSLSLEIDSLFLKAKNLKNLPEIDFNLAQKGFIDELRSGWQIENKTDTSSLFKTKKAVFELFKEYTSNIQFYITIKNSSNDIKAKNEELEKLRQDYQDLKTEFNLYKVSHP